VGERGSVLGMEWLRLAGSWARGGEAHRAEAAASHQGRSK